MKTQRTAAVLGVIAATALVATACGSDNNTGTTNADGASSASCGGNKRLTGEGSTAQQNAINEFVTMYGQQDCPGYTVAYNATGSGTGISKFNDKQVDFAGTDSPLKAEEAAKARQRCDNNPAWHIPLVFGPVTIAYNLPGASNVTLNPTVIAKIFNGGVKKWNDPAITALNSGVNLPDKDILVIFRSDESGTTDNFQKYLKAAAKDAWGKEAGKTFNGGVGEGKAKSAGVAGAVAATEGAITYVEASFADNAKLGKARIDSGAGAVELTNESAGKAIAGAKLKTTESPNDMVIDLDALYSSKTPGAYPLVLTTYEVVCSKGYADADTAKAMKNFLTSAATSGQANLPEVGYIPLPEDFKTKVLASINSMS